MTQNAQVIKQGNENNASLLRRFTRRVQQSGTLYEAKKRRYYKRSLSPEVQKQNKLSQLERAKQIKWLVKIGRIADKHNS